MDLFDLKGISIGDWVECTQLSGYWLVTDIKESYLEHKKNGFILIMKRGFNSKMVFQNGTGWCHVHWCSKVSDAKLNQIEMLFLENPLKKSRFDEYPMKINPAIQSWFLTCDDSKIDNFQKQLSSLDTRFTEKQFYRYVNQLGLRKYMKNYSQDSKFVLRVHSFPWEVDENLSQLCFDPIIEELKNVR